MNLKLITEHKEYWLLVDTEAPIEAMVTPTYNEVVPWGEFKCSYSISKMNPFVAGVNVFEGIHKIIAHLPKNEQAPLLPGVLLLLELPKQEEDADQQMLKVDPELIYLNGKEFNIALRGYKAAQKEEETIKHLKTLIHTAKGLNAKIEAWNGTGLYHDIEQAEKYLQSLSPSVVDFVPEYMESTYTGDNGKIYLPPSLKTTKSTYRGQEVEILQGKWIF